MIRIRKPAVLSLHSLKITKEFSSKQTMSPKGQRLKREQFDEAVSCMTNIE